jgi:hypothetical protein
MYAVVGWISRTFVTAKETVRHDEINNIILVYLPRHSIIAAGLMVLVLLLKVSGNKLQSLIFTS